MRTPVTIAIIVLVLTQAMNLVFVPWLGHAGLALSVEPGGGRQRGLAVHRPAPRRLVPAGAGLAALQRFGGRRARR